MSTDEIVLIVIALIGVAIALFLIMGVLRALWTGQFARAVVPGVILVILGLVPFLFPSLQLSDLTAAVKRTVPQAEQWMCQSAGVLCPKAPDSGGTAAPPSDVVTSGDTEPAVDEESGAVSGPAAPPADGTVSTRTTTGADSPSAAPATEAAAATDSRVVTVKELLYATNRKVTGAGTPKIAYGTTRGPLKYGAVNVSIPLAHERGQIERPLIIKIGPLTVYEEEEDPAKHFIVMTPAELTKDAFAGKIAAAPKKRALVYIHGFKTSFKDAALSTAQIAYDIKFDGVPIFFSWPSLNQLDPRAYVTDSDAAGAAAPDLASVLRTVRAAVGPSGEIFLIAHSMGNVPLIEYLYNTVQAAVPARVADEIIFAAPDVDKDFFLSRIEALTQHREQMTLYASSKDKALYASSNFLRIGSPARAGSILAGQPVIIVPGVDTIDVSALSTDWWDLGHGTYAQDGLLLSDIAALVNTRAYKAPDARTNRLRAVTVESGKFWRVPN